MLKRMHVLIKAIALAFMMGCMPIVAQDVLLSVIVPVRSDQDNVAQFLQDIIKQSAINNLEILLLNTTKSDAIQKDILSFQEHYRVRQLRLEQDLDGGGLWNLSLNQAKAKYLTIVDINTRYHSQALSVLISDLERNPLVDAVYSDYGQSSVPITTFEPNSIGKIIELPEYTPAALGKGVPGRIAVWRVSLHNRAGYFRQDLKEQGLWEFFNRAAFRGAVFKKCQGVLAVHYENLQRALQNEEQMQETQEITQTYQSFWQGTIIAHQEKPMVVVIPSYNNVSCCIKTLESVFRQRYTNYRIIYLNDASTDGTGQAVERYVRECHQEHRFTMVNNTTRQGAAANKYRGAQLCKDDEIYIDLDGDDWFAHEFVLDHLNRIYANPDVWVTYGQFVYYPLALPGWAGQLPLSVIESNRVRQNDWVTTALRTFYAGLFKRVQPEDLMIDGKFVTMAGDLAFMFCIMEMAGHKSVFIPEVLYVYNIGTNNNDGTLNRQLQLELGFALRNKKPYERVKHYIRDEKNIYITPGFWGDLFDLSNPYCNRDDCLQPTYQMRQRLQSMGYNVHQVTNFDHLDNAAAVICFEMPDGNQLQSLLRHPKEKRILFLWEPPSVLPQGYDKRIHELFGRVYTWADDLVDNKKYFKLYCPVWCPMIDTVVDFDQKQFCTMIACNKGSSHPRELYSKRRELIDFFEQQHPDDFDLYGRGWDANRYDTYKGSINKKIDYLKHYKFGISYENLEGMNGYVTEKIFHCMQAGCVPVYWGAANIDQYVPKECFIDRRNFASNQQLYDFLKSITNEQYQTYIENIKTFMKSPQAMKFSGEAFVTLCADLMVGIDPQPSQKTITAYDENKFYFVTAANAGYFDALINMIGSLHATNYERIGQIAVFDLGMTEDQRNTLSKIEKLSIHAVDIVNPDLLKPFNTRAWGKPVPGWYAWKPVIIKQALDMFPCVLYIDAGTTVYRPLDDLFDHIKKHGYFLHNGCSWHVARMTTDYVKSRFDLYNDARKWVLGESVYGLEAGFMGLTARVYEKFVMPMYQLAKHDLRAFVDDGTCVGGFGNSRHDLTLFSLCALLNNMHIYHHFEKPLQDMMLDTFQGQKPFHIACNPWDRTERTHIYASRFDVDLARFKPSIRWRKE